ncbi:CHAT domain-containing protein [Streptomyces sp. NPDC093681]|uniref:CHAT domain-containing protein n=1 Tax=Streptomyces sp. NPDC093681 TaxID=3155202 RepID=UPI00343D4C90
MSSWRERVESRIVSAVQRRLGVELVKDLGDVDDQDVQAIARLYRILDRKPVYAAALNHIVSAVEQHYTGPSLKPLTGCLISSLLHETGMAFQARGFTEEAKECDRLAAALAPGGPDHVILSLLSAISSQQELHLLTPLTVDAVLRALLHETSRSGRRIRRAGILISVAYAAHTTGNIERLGAAVEALSHVATTPGAAALATYYHSRHLIATGDMEAALTAETQFKQQADAVTARDKDYKQVEFLRSSFRTTSSAMARASAAVRAEDYVGAAHWYERSGEELPAGPMRAAMCVLAESARVLGDLLSSVDAVRAALSRLRAGDAFAARSTLDLEMVLTGMLMRTVDLYEAADQTPGRAPDAEAMLVAEVADLLGEVRGGAAVGHPKQRDAYRSDALADLTLLKLLSRTPRPVAPSEIAERLPDHHVVWVVFSGARIGEHVLTVVTLRPSAPYPLVRRTSVSMADGKALAQCSDEESEEAPEDALLHVRSLVFADLDPAASAPRILLVPDNATWSMPWSELAPPHSSEVTLTRSAAATLRSRRATRVGPKRVIGIFDEQGLRGSRKEARALEELAEQGHIHFTRVHSLPELDNALANGSYDVLTISVHGTADDGVEYRMLLPDKPSSPAALLHLALPPTVVLGCCWSAKSPDTPDTTAAALSCLAAGASQVIGGLWAIDDEMAGELLTRTYDGHLRHGLPLAQAFRAAHLALPRDDRPAAAGLAFMGHP